MFLWHNGLQLHAKSSFPSIILLSLSPYFPISLLCHLCISLPPYLLTFLSLISLLSHPLTFLFSCLLISLLCHLCISLLPHLLSPSFPISLPSSFPSPYLPTLSSLYFSFILFLTSFPSPYLPINPYLLIILLPFHTTFLPPSYLFTSVFPSLPISFPPSLLIFSISLLPYFLISLSPYLPTALSPYFPFARTSSTFLSSYLATSLVTHLRQS